MKTRYVGKLGGRRGGDLARGMAGRGRVVRRARWGVVREIERFRLVFMNGEPYRIP
jgi:hypothetical protein